MSGFRPDQGSEVGVEAGNRGDVTGGVEGQRNWKVEGDIVFNALQIELNVTVLEILKQAKADLSALVGRIAWVTNPIVGAIEAADIG